MALILIVEDDPFIRELVEMTIQEWGYETATAGSSDEAMSIIRSPTVIDAMFTDIYLKAATFGGCDLAHRALEIRPDLRVLYTTGNYVTANIRALFVTGTECLPKPYTPDQLRRSLAITLAA